VIRGYALVDAADADWANQWKWYLGCHNGVVRNRDASDDIDTPKTPHLHRELLGLKQGDKVEVDHINRNRLDNRRANLRIVPKGSQPQNVPSMPGSISKYRGVTFKRATGKWVAQIRADGKQRHLGTFITEEEAAAVAREARLRLLPYAVD
jgi:bifunctional DNA-binding transcriptional regulator/antitoxin component of YhaV-PrlF toxin-antitoxin module